MPRKKWTTEQQEKWLSALLPQFCTAQQDKTTQNFYPTVYKEWFAKFPSRVPTEEELQDAKGNAQVAAALINKADREVSINNLSHLINLINSYGFSGSIGGSGTTRAQLRLVQIHGVC